MKCVQSFNLSGEFEKKAAAIMPSSAFEKCIREVEHVPPDLECQTNDVPTFTEMSRCVAPSAATYKKSLANGVDMECSNLLHEVQNEDMSKIDGSIITITVSEQLEVAKVCCST